MKQRRSSTATTRDDGGTRSAAAAAVTVVTRIRVAPTRTAAATAAATRAQRWISAASAPLRLLLLCALLPLLSVLGEPSRPLLLTQSVDASLCGDWACNAHGVCAGLFEYSAALDTAGNVFPYVQVELSCICDSGWDSGGALAPAYSLQHACSQHVSSLLGLHVIWLAITLGALCYALVKLRQSISVIQSASAKKRAQAIEDRLAAFDMQTGGAGLPGHVTFGPSSQPQIEMSQTAARERRATFQMDGRPAAGAFTSNAALAAERSQLFTADGSSNPLSAGTLTRGYSNSNADMNGAPALAGAGARENGGSISMAGGTASMRARSSRHTYQKPSFVTAALDRARAAQGSEAARQRASSFAHGGGNRVADGGGASSPIGASFASSADDQAVDFAAVMRALRTTDAAAGPAAAAPGSARASPAHALSSRRIAGLAMKISESADDASNTHAGHTAAATSPVPRSRHSPSPAANAPRSTGALSPREKSQSRHLTVGDLEEDLEDGDEGENAASKPLTASTPGRHDSNRTPPPSTLFGLHVQVPLRAGSGFDSTSPNASLSPQPSPRTLVHSPSAQGRASAMIVVSSSAVDTDDTPTASPAFGPLGGSNRGSANVNHTGQHHSLPPTPQASTPNPPPTSSSSTSPPPTSGLPQHFPLPPPPPPPPNPPAVPAPAAAAASTSDRHSPVTIAAAQALMVRTDSGALSDQNGHSHPQPRQQPSSTHSEPTSLRPSPAGRTGSMPSSRRGILLRPAASAATAAAAAAAAAAASHSQKTSPSPTKRSALNRFSSSSVLGTDESTNSGGGGIGSTTAAIIAGTGLGSGPAAAGASKPPNMSRHGSSLATSPWVLTPAGSPTGGHGELESIVSGSGGSANGPSLLHLSDMESPALHRLGTRDPLDPDEEVDFATSMGGVSPFHIYRRPEHFNLGGGASLASSVASSPRVGGMGSNESVPPLASRHASLLSSLPRRVLEESKEQGQSPSLRSTDAPVPPMQRTLSSEEREAEAQQLGGDGVFSAQPAQGPDVTAGGGELSATHTLFTIHSPAFSEQRDILSASASAVVSPFAAPVAATESEQKDSRELQRFPLDQGQPPLRISAPMEAAAALPPQPQSAAPASSKLVVRPSRHSRAGSHGGVSSRLHDGGGDPGNTGSALSFAQQLERRRRSSVSPQPSPSLSGALHVPTGSLHRRGGSSGAGGSAGNINMLLVDNQRFTPEPGSQQHVGVAPGSARTHRLRTHGSASLSSKRGEVTGGVPGAGHGPSTPQPRRSSMSSPSNVASQRALAASPSGMHDGGSSPPVPGRSVAFSTQRSGATKAAEPGHPVLGTPADIADKPAFILGLSSQRIDKRRPAGSGLLRQGSLRVLNTWQPNVGGVEITQNRPSDFGAAGLMSQHGTHVRGGAATAAASALALQASLGSTWSLKFLLECCRHISFQYSLGACLCASLQVAHIVSQLVFEARRQSEASGLADHERSMARAVGTSKWLTLSYALVVLIFSAITHLFFGSHLKLAYSMVGLRGITQQQQQQQQQQHQQQQQQSAAVVPIASGGGGGGGSGTNTLNGPKAAAGSGASTLVANGVPLVGVLKGGSANANGNGTGSGTTTPRRHSTANGRNVRVIRPGGGTSISSKHTQAAESPAATPAVTAVATGPPTLMRAPTLTGVGGALGFNSGGSTTRSNNLFQFHSLSSMSEARVIKAYMLLHCVCSGVLIMLLCWLPTIPRSDPALYEQVVRIAFVAIAVMGLHFTAFSVILTLSLKYLLAAGTSSLNLRQFSERQSVVFRLQVLVWSNRLLGLPALVFVLMLAFVSARLRVQSASYLLPLLHIILSCIILTRLWSLNWKTKGTSAQAPATAAVADRSQNHAQMHAVMPGAAATAAAAPTTAGSRGMLTMRPERAGSVGPGGGVDRMTSFRFPAGVGPTSVGVPPLLGSTAQLGSFNTNNRGRAMTGSATGHARKPSVSSSSLSHNDHDADP